jgi:Ca2+-binding RTX toxin-like protein
MYGGAGNDTINASGGDDTIWAGSGNDTVNAGEGADTVRGGAGDDTLHGDGGNDYMLGGQGNDIIYGDTGNDIIIGGEGNDTLYGGAGADEFVFNLGDGMDTVMGFENGDQLTFNGISLNGGDQVGITAAGNDVVITIIGQDGAQGSQVTLKDAAAGMSDSQKEHISDGYSVTDTGNGVSVVIDQNS